MPEAVERSEVAGSLTPAVSSAIRILDEISAASKPLTFSELQLRLDLPKSSLSRLLQTLLGAELLDLDRGRYQIGTRVLDYYASYARRLDIITIFHRVADDLGEGINETMQLAQLHGQEVVFVAKRDCQRLIRPAAFPGRRVPAHATAVGKAMLAHLPGAELSRLYPHEALAALTAHTLTSRDALARELVQARAQGYACTRQESTLNLCCFSSPVFAAGGQVVAALSVCLATEEPTAERRDAAVQAAQAGARRLSHALGHRDLP